MKPKEYTSLSANWKVNLETAEFSSPSKDEPSQMIIFGGPVKDGTITCSVTPIAGHPDPNWGHDFRECAFLFRYRDKDNFYTAGVGGFGMKFYIAKVSSSQWQLLDGTGQARWVNSGEAYCMRVEFSGTRIRLFHNEVPVLSAVDGEYFSGLCGLRSNYTQAEFKLLDIQAVKPKCFVIMPFDAELDFVYRVIKDTVEHLDMVCLRADERLISEPILDDVKSQIAEADLIVVDFTNRNPNVYFEAGIADAWKKKWVVLSQSANDLAFDVRHIRTITYSDKMGADAKLREELQHALKETLGATAAAASA